MNGHLHAIQDSTQCELKLFQALLCSGAPYVLLLQSELVNYDRTLLSILMKFETLDL